MSPDERKRRDDAIIERLSTQDRIPLRLSFLVPSGAPGIVSLWFIREGAVLWCATKNRSFVVGNLVRDGRVGFEVSNELPPYRGFRGGGVAEVVPERGREMLDLLLAKYLGGLDSEFAARLRREAEDEVAIRIAARWIKTWDYSVRMRTSVMRGERRTKLLAVDHPKRRPPGREIMEEIASRWSPCGFSSRAIPRETILALLEAARWAPSSANEQPWTFTVVERDRSEVHTALLESLAPPNRAWAANAPVLVVVAARTISARTGRHNPHAEFDTGQAYASFAIEGTNRGIAVHPMGGFDRELARGAVQLPADQTPIIVAALGECDGQAIIPEPARKRDLTPRERKPVESFTAFGTWPAADQGEGSHAG